jgi:hypothetical protein
VGDEGKGFEQTALSAPIGSHEERHRPKRDWLGGVKPFPTSKVEVSVSAHRMGISRASSDRISDNGDAVAEVDAQGLGNPPAALKVAKPG